MKSITTIGFAFLIGTSGNLMARHNSSFDYAKVVDVEPITKQFRVSSPRRECWQEQVAHQDYRDHRSVTPTLLGSVIGGAIGNELGHHKDAKRAGVVVGALLGGSIGRDIGRKMSGPGQTYYTSEEVCRSYQDYHQEERTVGYQVFYRYKGETYSTETRHHPGDRIKVRVSVTPVDEGRAPASYRY